MNELCRNAEEPDLWFPELPVGYATASKIQELVTGTKEAISMCNRCPAQQECLTEGMKSDNIPYGIWGGLMAGERILLTGKTHGDYGPTTEHGKALYFVHKLQELVRT